MQICTRFQIGTRALTNGCQTTRHETALALVEVPAVQVQADNKCKRVTARVFVGPRINAGALTRPKSVASVKDLAAIQPDSFPLPVCFNVRAKLVKLAP